MCCDYFCTTAESYGEQSLGGGAFKGCYNEGGCISIHLVRKFRFALSTTLAVLVYTDGWEDTFNFETISNDNWHPSTLPHVRVLHDRIVRC